MDDTNGTPGQASATVTAWDSTETDYTGSLLIAAKLLNIGTGPPHTPRCASNLACRSPAPTLQLLDGVGPQPVPGPAAADVPAAGRDRGRPINGDVALEEVQAFAFLDPEEAETLDPERVKRHEN